jgi:hypothetical protein
MLPELLINGVLTGVLGGRRKRSRRALHFLTNGRGGGLWANPQTLLTAAGVAWGIFDTLQASPSASQGAGQPASGPNASQWWEPQAASAPSGPSDATQMRSPVSVYSDQDGMSERRTPGGPPPMPPTGGAADRPSPQATASSDDTLRIVRLAISAAHADGAMNEQERAAIAEQLKKAGAGDLIERELASPLPLKEIVAGVTDPSTAATLYVLAFTILRADEQLTGAERIYLAQLAYLLHLERDTVDALEKDIGARIDAIGDPEHVGG